MNKYQIINLFLTTIVILVIYTKGYTAQDTNFPETPILSGEELTTITGGTQSGVTGGPDVTDSLQGSEDSLYDADGLILESFDLTQTLNLNIEPPGLNIGSNTGSNIGSNTNTGPNNNNVILLQLIRPPQEGKSLLKELLFLPPAFYQNPVIEEGYTLYAICHSSFNFEGGENTDTTIDGTSIPTPEIAGAAKGDAGGGGGGAAQSPGGDKSSTPGGTDSTIGGTGEDTYVDPAFDKLGNENEGVIQYRNKKLTFKYGNSLQEKSSDGPSIPFCKTRHRFDVFEKQEFQSACNAKVYTVGLNISGTIITFAESCFDILRNKVHYVHYYNKPVNPVPYSYIMPDFEDETDELNLHDWDFKEKKYRKLKRSVDNINFTNQALRSKRALYVIFNTTVERNPYKQAFLPEQYFRPVKIDISDVLRKNIGEQAEFLKFSEANLFPPITFAPYVSNPFENLEFLQSFIGWDNLVYGNWHLFNDLLERRIFELADHKVSYNIFAGTSHIAEAVLPDCDDLKELGIREYGKLKPIPKYVWMYLNSKETNEDFVVIGINTPYNPFFQKSDIFFCNDMCDQIEWLKPLEIMRKINTFGRLFCCERSQSETLLNHFPVRPTLTSSE